MFQTKSCSIQQICSMPAGCSHLRGVASSCSLPVVTFLSSQMQRSGLWNCCFVSKQLCSQRVAKFSSGGFRTKTAAFEPEIQEQVFQNLNSQNRENQCVSGAAKWNNKNHKLHAFGLALCFFCRRPFQIMMSPQLKTFWQNLTWMPPSRRSRIMQRVKVLLLPLGLQLVITDRSDHN